MAASWRDLGITPVSLSGHAQLQTPEARPASRRAIDIAAALGMEVVNTYTGDATTAEERDAYFVNVAELCDQAARHGLKIGMETDSNMLPTAEAGVEILDRIDRPDVLGFNYDPGNVVYYTGADPLQDVYFALPRLVHVHLKDKIGGKGVFNFPPPGDGELDLRRLLAILDEAGYAGPDQRRSRVRRARLARLRRLPRRRQTLGRQPARTGPDRLRAVTPRPRAPRRSSAAASWR